MIEMLTGLSAHTRGIKMSGRNATDGRGSESPNPNHPSQAFRDRFNLWRFSPRADSRCRRGSMGQFASASTYAA